MLNDHRDYFQNDYIAGRVDFIYGSATAMFDRCEIHSKNGGHITAGILPGRERRQRRRIEHGGHLHRTGWRDDLRVHALALRGGRTVGPLRLTG